MSLLNKLKVGDELSKLVISHLSVNSQTRYKSSLKTFIYGHYFGKISYISRDYIMLPYQYDNDNWILLNYTCRNPLP